MLTPYSFPNAFLLVKITVSPLKGSIFHYPSLQSTRIKIAYGSMTSYEQCRE